MSKFGWDLPPGVTHSMIEEAAGGDAKAEAQADEIYKLLLNAGIDTDMLDGSTGTRLIEDLQKLMGSAYTEGYDQGRGDEREALEAPVRNLQSPKESAP
jgi:hypothetical protein